MSSSESISDQLRSLDLSATLVHVWLNGIALCIAFVALHALYFGRDSSPRKYAWSFIVVLLYASSTIQMAIDWGNTINPIIDFGGTPKLPDALDSSPLWAAGVNGTFFSLNILIADLIFIWRCWVVWERRWIVTLLPLLATLAGLVLNVLSLIGQNEAQRFGVSATAPLLAAFIRFSTPYLALSLATTMYTTCMIIGRILSVAFSVRNAGIKRSFLGRYLAIIEILVESALLYSLTILAFVILLARGDEDDLYPETMLSQISCIAPTLIILRVALGHAKMDEHISHYTPTSLAFAAHTTPAQSHGPGQSSSAGYGVTATSDVSTKFTSSNFRTSSQADDRDVKEKV